MINKYVAIGLGALIALAPVAAVAQQQVAAASTTTAAPATGHMGSHRSHLRRKGNTAAERARASAHHMHKMRKAPAAAPKS